MKQLTVLNLLSIFSKGSMKGLQALIDNLSALSTNCNGTLIAYLGLSDEESRIL